jgi:2-C-methyl-D-erythritol 2,4-cyclodiphosphate synthase
MVLGGVTIEGDEGLSGHSDADVLCHAIGDAVLGAAGRGDLGEWFPSTDEWKDSSSIDLLKRVADTLRDEGWTVTNVDATLIAERPRVSGHKDAMRQHIAAALGIEASRVSVKATTTDGLGAMGRAEGIAAMAIAAVERPT